MFLTILFFLVFILAWIAGFQRFTIASLKRRRNTLENDKKALETRLTVRANESAMRIKDLDGKWHTVCRILRRACKKIKEQRKQITELDKALALERGSISEMDHQINVLKQELSEATEVNADMIARIEEARLALDAKGVA